MGVVRILEGTTKAQDEWTFELGVTVKEIEYLVSARVLRFDECGELVLTFVGIVVFNNTLLFASPKFDAEGNFGISDILYILRSYFSRSRSRRPVINNRTDPEYGDDAVLKEYDALRLLQSWFRDHGIYRREQALTSSQGRPHWVKTVAKCSPVLIQGSAIYPTVIAEKRDGVLNDISALQVGTLRLLLERYGLPDSGGAIEHAEQATGSVVSCWPVPEDQRIHFERRLLAEQRGVYRTDMLRLLRLLRGVLDTSLAGLDPRPQIYGTTAFYSVWEDACRVTLGVDDQAASNTSLGRPVWWVCEAGRKVSHDHLQIPDIMVIRDSWHIIADAKYYYPFPSSRPGGPDIVKQLYYAESLTVSEARVLSIFLLPLPSQGSPTFLGCSTIEGASRKFAQIEAWGLDPAYVFLGYPAVSTGRANGLIDAVLRQRDRVAEFIGQSPADVSRER